MYSRNRLCSRSSSIGFGDFRIHRGGFFICCSIHGFAQRIYNWLPTIPKAVFQF
jgi:hypothetical protein